MTETGIPQHVHRLIFIGIVVYFGLFAIGTAGGIPIAVLLAETIFGAIALGLGVVLFQQTDGERSLLFGAAVALVVGGIAQFGFLIAQFAGLPEVTVALQQLSSLGVFAGIGLYVYVIWVLED